MNKVIYVSGEDYASLFFEDWVRNNNLTFEEASELGTIEDDEGYAEIEVYSFGEVDPKFIKFMYNIQDYDDSKHRQFYLKTNDLWK